MGNMGCGATQLLFNEVNKYDHKIIWLFEIIIISFCCAAGCLWYYIEQGKSFNLATRK